MECGASLYPDSMLSERPRLQEDVSLGTVSAEDGSKRPEMKEGEASRDVSDEP